MVIWTKVEPITFCDLGKCTSFARYSYCVQYVNISISQYSFTRN